MSEVQILSPRPLFIPFSPNKIKGNRRDVPRRVRGGAFEVAAENFSPCCHAANGYDELAIRVETAAGERIGWVPKKHNDVLARLMDAGKLLVAKVTYKG